MDASTSLLCSPFPKNVSNPESVIEETVHASHKEVVIPSWAKELVESSRAQQKAIKYIQWKVTDNSLKIKELSKDMKTLLSLLKPRVDDPGCAEASPDLKADDLVVEEQLTDKKEKELKENELKENDLKADDLVCIDAGISFSNELNPDDPNYIKDLRAKYDADLHDILEDIRANCSQMPDHEHLFDSLLIDCCGEVGDLVGEATELGEKREETIAPETEVVTEKAQNGDEVAPEKVDEVAQETEIVT